MATCPLTRSEIRYPRRTRHERPDPQPPLDLDPRREVRKGPDTAAVVSTAIIQPLADLNDSHAFNEDRPPHAHFHDLAAVGMLEICCATSLYLLHTRRGDRHLNTAFAAILPAAFWAPFFPAHFIAGSSLDDTTAHHPAPKVPHVGRFKIYPNASAAAVELGLLALGWWRFRQSRRAA
jgi:hypothetical protein